MAEFPKDERRKLLEENVLDITRNFNRRVQSFRKNILKAPQSPLKIQFFQDRTEMQSRGFGHIHGCAWSDFKKLEEKQPGLKLCFLKLKQNKRLSNKDKQVLAKFVNKTVTCTLSVKKVRKFGISKKRAMKIINMVKDVNVHNHTKTCRKYSTDCRFMFPRYPSYFTIIAQEQPAELLDEEKANFWTNIDLVLERVQDALKDLKDLEVNLEVLITECFTEMKIENKNGIKKILIKVGERQASFCYNDVLETAAFLSGTHINDKKDLRKNLVMAVYHYCLTFCRYGTKVILEREVSEIFVNNYNPHWMEAWNANMDLQICLDYFSIITYMTDYVTKPETKTTEALKQVKKIKEKQNASTYDLMQALIQTYLTHREMGECESYYRLDPTLHYKQSNIGTIFLNTGFPGNRSKFLRKCSKDNEAERGFEVDEHEGKFIETETILDRYLLRPLIIAMICLVQFAMWYTLLSPQETTKFLKKFKNEKECVYIPSVKERKQIFVCNDIKNNPPQDNKNLTLPDYVILKNRKVMRLRKFARVVRKHKFNQDNNPHEYFYSQLMMYMPFFDESELFEEDIEKCRNLFEDCNATIDGNNPEPNKIENVKMQLFPHLVDVEEGREMVEKFEYDNLVGTELDPKGEQLAKDAADIGFEEAEEYSGFDPDGLEDHEEDTYRKSSIPDGGFQVPDAVDIEKLLISTRQLVDEQKIALNIIICYCKELRKSMAQKTLNPPKPPLLVVHGGAGTGKSTLISVASSWAHKILKMPGDDPDCPYVIRTAPTGMAAANIEGATLHHALKLGFGNQHVALSDKNRALLYTRLKNAKLLIIDEFSMIKSDQLYQLHLRLCEIKQNDSVFGNLSLVLLGDLMQLKPIRGSYICQMPKYEKYRQVFELLPLWKMFETIELEINHRQGDDKRYAELLNRLRFKSKDEDISEEDLKLLNSRISSRNVDDDVTKVFGKNASVNCENSKQLQKSEFPLYTIQAIHTPKNRTVKITPAGTIEDTAFLDKLEVKEQARVMLIHNVNTSDGLTNGAQGIIVKILTDDSKVRYILVKFDNKKVGRLQRQKFSFLSSKCDLSEVTPVERTSFSYTLGDTSKNHAARATVLQFPMRLCWALTAHKVGF